MRQKLVAGNWKMHTLRQEARNLVDAIKQSYPKEIEILLIPPFIHLAQTAEQLQNTNIRWGAQNCYVGTQGAFTGEISAPMLKDYGCHYVLIGHSERRHIFHESLDLIAAKCHSALSAGVTPILCVGETLAHRENNQTEEVIREQLDSVIAANGMGFFNEAVIAYEPVWAIGTGHTATPEQAEEVHRFIREHLSQEKVEIAERVRILYGGSVKADNAAGLFAMPNIDGALVGGASLEAKSFLAICEAGVKCTNLF